MHLRFYLPFLFLLNLGFYNLTAQTNSHGAWETWSDVVNPDTVRFKALDDVIWDSYMYRNPDSAVILATQLYDFAFERLSPAKQSIALNTIGVAYWSKGEYLKAIEYYERNLTLSDSIGNKHGVASSLNNIGAIYHNRGDYPRALRYFKRCLKVNEEQGYTSMVAVAVGNIGMIYREQFDLDNALKYSQRSLELYKQLGDQAGIARGLMSIGNIYVARKERQKGLEYYQQAIEIRKEINDQRGLVTAISMTGNLLLSLGQIEEALEYYNQSITLARSIGDRRGEIAGLLDYGFALNDLKKPQEAAELCLEGFELALSMSLLKEQRKACECLYDSYKALGNNTLALKYFELKSKFTDSLQQTETAKKLQQMEFEKQLLADSAAHFAERIETRNTYEKELIKEHNVRNMAVISGVFALLLAFGLYRRSRFVKKSNRVLQQERDRSNELLLNILPFEVAEELKEKGESEARDFDQVTVLFTDFQEFTQTAEKLTAKQLVNEINACFMAFDEIIERHRIEKIKTIGDAYMAAGGLHVPRNSEPADVVLAALEMQQFMLDRKAKLLSSGLASFDMRVGIHTGPVVAGIVGVKKFQFDIWGDTVNTASRMESHGATGKVNISDDTYNLIKDDPRFEFESRGKVEVKGKGEMEMYFVTKN